MSHERWLVEWKPDAETKMGRILYTSADRSAVLAAAKAIESLLEEDPFAAGESRSTDQERLVIHPPLAAYCEVFVKQRRGEIYTVWRWSGA